MPELPEVRTVVKRLNEKVMGKVIKDVEIIVPKLIREIEPKDFSKAVKNKKIISIDNVGKFIVFNLGSEVKIVSHLRMTGKYRVEKEYKPRKNDRLIFKLEDTNLVYIDERMFGTFQIRDKNYLQRLPLSKLALEPEFIDAINLHNKLSRKRIAIKTSLLDQTLVLGLGNIYVNETLWETKIDPSRPSNQVTLEELKYIIHVAHKIMNKATKYGGSTIDNYKQMNEKTGEYQKFLVVHGKRGSLCPRCKNEIVYKKVNGRGTFWCSYCQR